MAPEFEMSQIWDKCFSFSLYLPEVGENFLQIMVWGDKRYQYSRFLFFAVSSCGSYWKVCPPAPEAPLESADSTRSHLTLENQLAILLIPGPYPKARNLLFAPPYLLFPFSVLFCGLIGFSNGHPCPLASGWVSDWKTDRVTWGSLFLWFSPPDLVPVGWLCYMCSQELSPLSTAVFRVQ